MSLSAENDHMPHLPFTECSTGQTVQTGDLFEAMEKGCSGHDSDACVDQHVAPRGTAGPVEETGGVLHGLCCVWMASRVTACSVFTFVGP
jgi:hypothetical protein